MRATAIDNSVAEAVDEGLGTPILVLHGGMGDPSAWERVTARLRHRFRTIRLHRRQYRLDLPAPVTMADEVEHVAAIASEVDRPLLVGHSSGAVLALEALVADPSLYRGAVLYEPPIVIDEPLGGAKLVPARRALDAGSPGKALSIFLRDVVGMPVPSAALAGFVVGRSGYAPRVARQLDDNDQIDALGVRLPAYAKIDLPVLLIGGDRSPAHLASRLDALEKALPRSRRLLMHGQGHSAELRAPGRVAVAIEKFLDEVCGV
ncbi:alpha/beta hydrolase [Winogradskya consettensis]|uniref:Alpha/beta hydrolase n=1 Tax=Winogradskya consettensis TaxID=113560 RepID=A0A919SDA7_9ACTN|nr:alpha/beta hydrolase [Actinoplanes consettensis]GIM68917.1 alpha/beta hydrolase [Actinoplanes consettensis]